MSSLTPIRHPRSNGELTRAKILAVLDSRAAAGQGAPVFEEIVEESKLPPRTVRTQIKLLRESGVINAQDATREVMRRVFVRASEPTP